VDPSTEQLFNHLLGDVGAGPGLLRRVGAKVADLTREGGPGFVTSSVMGAGSHRHDSDPSEDAERVLDLAVGLIEWRSPDVLVVTEVVQHTFVRYLRRERLSDAEFLLGSKRVGKGYIEQVRDEVRNLLTREVPQREQCEQLEGFLRDWLATGCDHDFEREEVEGTGSTVMVCRRDCGAKYWVDRRDQERWLAVG
jgi:hypothetical protein